MATEKAVGYIRVSTERQAEEGLGLAVQEAAIRSWAKDRNAKIASLFSDEGVSGALGAGDRPGLAEALAWIADNKADVLVVHRLDRLARSLTLQEAILNQVWAHQGSVWTTEGVVDRDDPDDPMRTFVRQVMGAAAQLER